METKAYVQKDGLKGDDDQFNGSNNLNTSHHELLPHDAKTLLILVDGCVSVQKTHDYIYSILMTSTLLIGFQNEFSYCGESFLPK